MLLAIDTIGRRVGIALWSEDSTVYENVWQANRNHTTTLIPSIEGAFRDCGISRGDVDSLAVCTGPGSFSAARAGVAVAKTLGFVWERPVYGGNCFEVGAHRMSQLIGDVLIVAPMGRGRWATQRFSCDGNAAVARTEPRVVDRSGGATLGGCYAAIVSDDMDVCGELNVTGELHVRKPSWLAAWAATQVAARVPGYVDKLEPYYLQGARITMSTRRTFRNV